MGGDEWFEDLTRLLRAELLVDDIARQAITAAAELLWDDLLDAVETDTVADALLIGCCPASFATARPATGDAGSPPSPRWCGNSGSPLPRRRQRVAEQLCVGALIGYTHTGVVALARDGMVDLDVPDDGIDVELWVEEYLADVDHELLYDPALDGIDDEVTDHQYGFGRMDYEGMFAVFNEHNDTATGAPHPLAALRMTATEWDDEQRLQRAVGYTAVAVAHTAIAGAARIHSLDSMLPVTPQRQASQQPMRRWWYRTSGITMPSASARRWVASARQPYAR